MPPMVPPKLVHPCRPSTASFCCYGWSPRPSMAATDSSLGHLYGAIGGPLKIIPGKPHVCHGCFKV